MSCIKGNAWRIGGIEKATATAGFGISNAKARKIGCIKACCSLICTINTNAFLRVTPTENMWIEVGERLDYNVFSNTNWEII